MFISNTHDDLLFFSNKGKVYCIKGYEVPEAERTARGRAIVNLLQLDNGEKVTAVIPRKENSQGNLFMATRNGLIKKTDLEEFRSIRKTGKIAISLVEGDELIGVDMTSGDDEILMASREGKCIRFAEKDVRAMGREAQGVRSMKLNDGDYVVDMAVVRPGLEVLTVSTNGFGKRSDIDDYRLQSRAGKGIKAGVFNDKTGKLVNLKLTQRSTVHAYRQQRRGHPRARAGHLQNRQGHHGRAHNEVQRGSRSGKRIGKSRSGRGGCRRKRGITL